LGTDVRHRVAEQKHGPKNIRQRTTAYTYEC
jgi:hypothetical protein